MAVALGRLTDDQTRCVHWNGPTDVIAIRFACCGKYYACFDCHAELETHPPQRWGADQLDETAVLCGVCGTELSIAAYLGCGFRCPGCSASFNPGCAQHYHLYFDLAGG